MRAALTKFLQEQRVAYINTHTHAHAIIFEETTCVSFTISESVKESEGEEVVKE